MGYLVMVLFGGLCEATCDDNGATNGYINVGGKMYEEGGRKCWLNKGGIRLACRSSEWRWKDGGGIGREFGFCCLPGWDGWLMSEALGSGERRKLPRSRQRSKVSRLHLSAAQRTVGLGGVVIVVPAGGHHLTYSGPVTIYQGVAVGTLHSRG